MAIRLNEWTVPKLSSLRRCLLGLVRTRPARFISPKVLYRVEAGNVATLKAQKYGFSQ